MIIQQNAFAVGSLNSADPNSHSFHSPDRQNSGAKKQGADSLFGGDDTLTITLPTCHRGPVDAQQRRLGEAISLSQTQGAFLDRVQQALDRMTELSRLAQRSDSTPTDRSLYTAEFSDLQQRIKEISGKMFDAAKTFSPNLSVCETDDACSFGNAVPSLVNNSIEGVYNPTQTAITDADSATSAVGALEKSIHALIEIRDQVKSNLQRLNATGEQLTALGPQRATPSNDIPNLRSANESTRSICTDILVKSGTAMLAQANALPESALQLLG